MKINITKKQYRLLLDILSIAEWVMDAYKVEEDPKSKPYKEVEQLFLSRAKEFGFDNLVEYDREDDKYYPTREYEDLETDRVFIDEFEDDVFWEELCNRLAKRDLMRTHGVEKVARMEILERLTTQDKIIEKYQNEFYENGLENLILASEKSDHVGP